MTSEKVAEDIGFCVRQNTLWQQLPGQIRQMFQHNQTDYNKYIINYSLKNQLRYRGNIVAKVYRHEQRYYELLVQKSINSLCLFPYHLADIITKGLRVTPFNYYLDVLCQLLRNDKSYDTLPNFTAADCLRILGIGRNEYLSLISDLKTNTTRALLFSYKPNPLDCLPRFPQRVRIESWWRIEVGNVLESDIRYVTAEERGLVDDLIDFGSQMAGTCDYEVVHNLYRKGLVYLDVPISSEDRISIPPLRNFVMNRVSGDYFENLMYKIFVSADEHMTIAELSQMLQVNLESVKQAVSLLCRLGFVRRQEPLQKDDIIVEGQVNIKIHPSWNEAHTKQQQMQDKPQITPLNYNAVMPTSPGDNTKAKQSPSAQPTATPPTTKEGDSSSISYLSSDGNNSDFSFANVPSPSGKPSLKTEKSLEDHELRSDVEDAGDLASVAVAKTSVQASPVDKYGKRVGFLFDSTLTAFLMMGNLSPGLKNHAVTMFEVGKLCEESMDTFLGELEKVSLLDAEGEGDVSRYFAHAVILRSTICSLRHLLPGGLDLLRIECLECLDQKTRDRVLEKKYKFLISAAPLTTNLSHLFSIPFFGQFYRSSSCSHMWTKLFYNHITGYGPPSLFLCRGSVLKSLPRIFLGYGKLLVNILHSDSYIINSSHFLNINEQLKNGCVLIQGCGITKPGAMRYEAFPFDANDPRQRQWSDHNAVLKLRKVVDLDRMCGYVTFLNTGVSDIGCEHHELAVHLRHNQRRTTGSGGVSGGQLADRPDDLGLARRPNGLTDQPTTTAAGGGGAVAVPAMTAIQDLFSPTDGSEVTSFARLTESPTPMPLKGIDENYFVVTPQHKSPSKIYASKDCNEILATELAKCIPQRQNDEGEVNCCLEDSKDIPPDLVDPVEAVDVKEEAWTLLDVHFGVPLFDVDCNTRICDRIVHTLCSNENLSALPLSAAKMNETFMNFVRQCLHFEDDRQDQIKIGKTLPMPRINLAFENGRVCYWNGR